jgi:hypothetical protein
MSTLPQIASTPSHGYATVSLRGDFDVHTASSRLDPPQRWRLRSPGRQSGSRDIVRNHRGGLRSLERHRPAHRTERVRVRREMTIPLAAAEKAAGPHMEERRGNGQSPRQAN